MTTDLLPAFADLTLDGSARTARRGVRAIALTPTEFDLLELFLRHPRQVLGRRQILREVWGTDVYASPNSVDVCVSYLRRKTESGGESRLIHTVRGVGYVLREADRG